MAVTGCTNPNATNYNAAADTENYSCQYLFKHDGQCHLFTDVQPDAIIDKSFTFSYSLRDESWVFFHDYIPDMYVHTREQLYTAFNNSLHKHNAGAPGVYYDGVAKPFFIDIIFSGAGDMLLESVLWVTEFLNTNDTDSYFATLSHIAIWNSYQHTGRIPLTQLWNSLGYDNTRRTKGQWSFNEFRDVLKENPGDFIQNIFKNYLLDATKVEPNSTWYSNAPMQDKWFCIRFEFDNSVNGKLIIHDTAAQVLKMNR